MRIGLLMCDHVRPEFRDIAGDYPDMFAAWLPQATLVPFEVVHGEFPVDINICDAYLCTGSKYSVYDDEPWIHMLQRFVQVLHEREKPYVGVCFGHQMIGQALGGRVEKAAVGWCVGVHRFTVHKREDWMDPYQPEFNVLMMCQDQIVELPPGAEVLASTADCPIGMIRVGRTVLGLQGHPEFPLEYERTLMQDRVGRIGAEKVDIGLASLGQGLDDLVLAAWMATFMEQAAARAS
jgi:GMP synthase-like glutamine amidotransferase